MVAAIRAKIEDLTERQSGTRIHKRLQALVTPNGTIPKAIVERVNRLVRARDGALREQRLATDSERELRRATGERLPPGPLYVEEIRGTIDGLAALYAENNLRTLLVKELSGPLDDFSDLDVDSLAHKDLARWSKWADSIEPTLKAAAAALGLGKRLLTEHNLMQLLPLVSSRADIRDFKAFVSSQ